MRALAAAALSLCLLDPAGAQPNEARSASEATANPLVAVQTLNMVAAGFVT